MKKAFVFDMDGVLIDSERLLLECLLAVAPAGSDLARLKCALMESLGVTNAEGRRIMTAYMGADFPLEECSRLAEQLYFTRVKAEGTPVKPGAAALLRHLNAGGYTVGLASSSPTALVDRQLALAGFADCFSVITTGDMVKNSKPAPDIYLLACDRLGIAPEEAYAVEDAPKGVRSAAAAGLSVLMVPDLAPATEELRPLCLSVFPTLNDVLDWVKACESNESE